MPSFQQFKLPDLGEGLTEGEILKWLVAPGDTITLNQPIVEVETAKAAVEVPSPYAGVVAELHHGEGETVDVGTPIITVDTDPSGAAPGDSAAASGDRAAAPGGAGAAGESSATDADDMVGGVVANARDTATDDKVTVLVGTGPKHGASRRRPRRAAESVAAPVPARESAAEVGAHAARVVGAVTVLAKPPVRKLAKELGVDLAGLVPSGPNGTVTRADVLAAAGGAPAPEGRVGGAPVPGGRVGGAPAPGGRIAVAPAPRAGGARETRIPIRGVRKHTAAAMVASAFSAPHVTEFMTVDVTRSLQLLERLRARRDMRDVRLTPLVLVAKALLLAVRRTPEVNATWDDAAQEIVVKHYVNLGIAAATPRGLLVPNVKDADALSLRELAEAIADLATTAREGRTSPADMAGGTITITNVGVFGVDSGTPILNPGEAAILCFGAVREQPWVVDGAVVPRMVTQLALSFDHRLVDGEQGSRFLADVGTLLQDPDLALAW